jgi:DNA-directed RNA polymerase subunit H (RpoH/RPB5)
LKAGRCTHKEPAGLAEEEKEEYMAKLNEEDVKNIMKRYNITDKVQFPDISRFDPVAQVIGIRPGQICEITRPSKTAIEGKYYRICV